MSSDDVVRSPDDVIVMMTRDVSSFYPDFIWCMGKISVLALVQPDEADEMIH
jgi:hypothetical protein